MSMSWFAKHHPGFTIHQQAVIPARLFFLSCWSSQQNDGIGERDVFTTRDAALDALEIHMGWVEALHPDVNDLCWELQEADVGRALEPNPGAGHSHIYVNDKYVGVAGNFESEAVLARWNEFIFSAAATIFEGHSKIEMMYGDLNDPDVRECPWICKSIGAWFVPVDSHVVHPRSLGL
ncbi:hypothetical protein [Rhodococcus qingshengii]|uniref:hypothetical protein n=1 Tax=Rhodococcus qingshengii TaxID=334542 RepID=UPI00294352F8|nr:hypothetical protein [Rhodococcus qingshengii]WOI85976.1 hypothetical protein R0122_22620 [Rhodococcus qingshengii]